MNPTRSTNVRRHEESRSARKEELVHAILRSRTEEERQRRRREFRRYQEYERIKEQKILEYERKRAQTLGYDEHKSSHRSRSKSGSKSPSHYQPRGRSVTSASKSGTLFVKLDGFTSGSVPLFKGAEGILISTTELRRIKVDIRRNIPIKEPITTELQRSILNAEDVVLKRRDGEGSKPIFDREEIQEAATKIDKVEERRTIVAVDEEQSVSSKPQTSKKRSSSSSSTYSSGYLPSHQSRYHTDSKRQDNKTEFRDRHKNKGRSSIERHREYKDKYAERDTHKYITNRSRSRERKSHSRSIMEERSYRDRYYDRSSKHSRERRDRGRDKDRDRDRSRERRDRDRSRERRDVAPHYIEPPIHVPNYYNLPPRPIVVSPMVPFRGQVPPMGRGRHSGLMAPVRPFAPRFMPPDMYRLGPPPPNPRYGPF